MYVVNETRLVCCTASFCLDYEMYYSLTDKVSQILA